MDHVSILLDIKEQIGALNANMMDARNSRTRMENNINELKGDIAQIKPVVAIVAKMEPEHNDLMRFRDRVGGYVWLGGVIAMGAIYLLWHGLMFFSDSIKTWLGRLFH